MTPSKRPANPRSRSRAQAPAAVDWSPPYPPSWVDRLTDWVERLPIPWWLFYVLMALVWSGIVALVLRQTGVHAVVGFHPMQVWLPTLTVYLLALTHGLDRAAAGAMQRFQPAFRGDEAEFRTAAYEMTTLPARTTLLLTLIASVVTLPFGRFEMALMQTGGLERVPLLFDGVLFLLYLTSYPFFYHVWHQLREIHRLLRDRAVVRLDDIRPIHALSRLTAATALGIAIFNYGWFAAQPGLEPGNPVVIGESLFSMGVALVVFIWPLWGAHRLLAEAKEQALAALTARKQTARAQLHEAVDRGRLDRIDPLHKALGVLQAEFNEISAVATWPWAPGTLRNLMGAVLLPVALWLIQFGLGRALG